MRFYIMRFQNIYLTCCLIFNVYWKNDTVMTAFWHFWLAADVFRFFIVSLLIFFIFILLFFIYFDFIYLLIFINCYFYATLLRFLSRRHLALPTADRWPSSSNLIRIFPACDPSSFSTHIIIVELMPLITLWQSNEHSILVMSSKRMTNFI